MAVGASVVNADTNGLSKEHTHKLLLLFLRANTSRYGCVAIHRVLYFFLCHHNLDHHRTRAAMATTITAMNTNMATMTTSITITITCPLDYHHYHPNN
jgi:hypothetical protein